MEWSNFLSGFLGAIIGAALGGLLGFLGSWYGVKLQINASRDKSERRQAPVAIVESP